MTGEDLGGTERNLEAGNRSSSAQRAARSPWQAASGFAQLPLATVLLAAAGCDGPSGRMTLATGS
jgi:hypothetical protein